MGSPLISGPAVRLESTLSLFHALVCSSYRINVTFCKTNNSLVLLFSLD